MNITDEDDALSSLKRQRSNLNTEVVINQNKFVWKVVNPLIRRMPGFAETNGPVDEFVVRARWLAERGTLEETYLKENEGGESLVRTLQRVAKAIDKIKSPELRRIVYDPVLKDWRLESWTDWAIPLLESQLNRWKHVPGAALPLRISVTPETLKLNPKYRTTLEDEATTLRFDVTDNPSQLLV